ncbi:hypothetical protein BDAP_000659 [Binucleata daphniae]
MNKNEIKKGRKRTVAAKKTIIGRKLKKNVTKSENVKNNKQDDDIKEEKNEDEQIKEENKSIRKIKNGEKYESTAKNKDERNTKKQTIEFAHNIQIAEHDDVNKRYMSLESIVIHNTDKIESEKGKHLRIPDSDSNIFDMSISIEKNSNKRISALTAERAFKLSVMIDKKLKIPNKRRTVLQGAKRKRKNLTMPVKKRKTQHIAKEKKNDTSEKNVEIHTNINKNTKINNKENPQTNSKAVMEKINIVKIPDNDEKINVLQENASIDEQKSDQNEIITKKNIKNKNDRNKNNNKHKNDRNKKNNKQNFDAIQNNEFFN